MIIRVHSPLTGPTFGGLTGPCPSRIERSLFSTWRVEKELGFVDTIPLFFSGLRWLAEFPHGPFSNLSNCSLILSKEAGLFGSLFSSDISFFWNRCLKRLPWLSDITWSVTLVVDLLGCSGNALLSSSKALSSKTFLLLMLEFVNILSSTCEISFPTPTHFLSEPHSTVSSKIPPSSIVSLTVVGPSANHSGSSSLCEQEIRRSWL